jgi:hypothetical protein
MILFLVFFCIYYDYFSNKKDICHIYGGFSKGEKDYGNVYMRRIEDDSNDTEKNVCRFLSTADYVQSLSINGIFFLWTDLSGERYQVF